MDISELLFIFWTSDYSNFRLFKHWIIQTSDYSSFGLFKLQVIQTLDYLNFGLFGFWIIRTLDYLNFGLFELWIILTSDNSNWIFFELIHVPLPSCVRSIKTKLLSKMCFAFTFSLFFQQRKFFGEKLKKTSSFFLQDKTF